MNLENIAASLGFKSADASSKAFERHVGVRPRIHRARCKTLAKKLAEAVAPNPCGDRKSCLTAKMSILRYARCASTKLRPQERLGLTNIKPRSLPDGVAGPRERAFAHVLKPSDYLISRVCNDRGSRPCDSDSNAPESSTSKLHEPNSAGHGRNTADRRLRY